MSVEEEAIEKWLGSKNTFFFPRLIHDNKIIRNPIHGRIGFVGTLNHTPNIIALEEICKILKQNNFSGEFRIVGSGETEGKLLGDKYKFVTYCGRLNDNELKQELSTWVCFLNPIFWYSRGASMKLAQALGWGLPVISTIAGARGYKFKNDFLILTSNNAQSFVTQILEYEFIKTTPQNATLNFSSIFYTADEIAKDFKNIIEQ
ncbi:MAG: glycosyltransferase [Sphingobacteriales bacterium]|nr:MAG: glycosyltransferase [Sphingobacteriales bacterium]